MKKSVSLYRHILLLVGLSKVFILALGILLYSSQYKLVCEEMMEMETENADYNGDACKKIAVEDWCESLYHFCFKKHALASRQKFIAKNENDVHSFSLDVLTPPPNSFYTL